VVDVHGRYTWDLARVQPYLTTGAGLYHLSPDDFDSSTDFGVPVGGGFDVPLNNRWRVGFNAAHHFVALGGPVARRGRRHDMVHLGCDRGICARHTLVVRR
jgi:hypothetical protein